MTGPCPLRLAAAFLIAAALAGCAGKRISDIDAPQPSAAAASGAAWSVPAGIAVAPDERGRLAIRGLYPSLVPNDRRCCWIGPDATLATRAVPNAKILRLDVLVPDYPFFEAAPQALDVSAGGTKVRFAGLAPGVHRLRVAIAGATPRERDGTVSFALHTERVFVPAREHVNADTRELGIIVLDVELVASGA